MEWLLVESGLGGHVLVRPPPPTSSSTPTQLATPVLPDTAAWPDRTLPLGLGDLHAAHRFDNLSPLLRVDGRLHGAALAAAQRVFDTPVRPERLMATAPLAMGVTLEPLLDLVTGQVRGHREVAVEPAAVAGDAKTSSSLLRDPAPYADWVRGQNTYRPFAPAGPADDSGSDPNDPGTRAISDEWAAGVQTEDLRPTTSDGDAADRAAATTATSFASALLGLDDVADFLEPTTSEAASAADEQASVVVGPAPVPLQTDPEQSALADAVLAGTVPSTITTSASGKGPAQASAGTIPAGRPWTRLIDVRPDFAEFRDLVPQLAHEYPFELDIFQKHAVYHLERHESVFVAAHTSAGKTVVAEYAIALAQRHLTRAIYTSPIKALSNQKFRDFRATFDDVGLLTGDVQIKPEAACLIMTTEILRSMLYRGADIIRDVEWVIFDEVHYINDQERGVVWEEVIIMLPAHVGIILLSATVPNTLEFADWVGRTKQREIFVISTLKRPVPLEYNLYVNKELYKIVDARREFLNDGYSKAVLAKNGDKKQAAPVQLPTGRGGGGRPPLSGHAGMAPGPQRPSEQQERTHWVTLVDFLRKRSLLPVVAFTFSKRRCESNAAALANIELTTGSERSEIQVFVDQSLKRLKGTDRELPQVGRTRSLLLRGLAVHHGGLLPIIKEMVEMLFSRGLVKVLFATETFAMGVNMPARTVVFSSLRKPDGKAGFRDLFPGEFTQMAGRAGRRGLDAVGTVIVPCFDDIPDTASLARVLLGEPTKLESRFRLTYLMILNLLRVQELRVQDMMRRSFSEFASQSDLPQQRLLAKQARKSLKTLERIDCDVCAVDLLAFYEANAELLQLNRKLQDTILTSTAGSKALVPGRLILVNSPAHPNAVAAVLKTETRATRRLVHAIVLCDAAVPVAGALLPGALPVRTVFVPQGTPTCRVVELALAEVAVLGKNRIKLELPPNRDRPDARELAAITQQLMQVAQDSSSKGLEAAHPLKDLKLNDLDMMDAYQGYQRRLDQLNAGFHCTRCPDLSTHAEQYATLHEQRRLEAELESLEYRLSDRNLTLLPEYEQRLAVLKQLGYIDDTGAIQLKGRVACEINTADEVLVTELILEGVFNELEPDELVALLSAFVFEERSDNEPVLTERLDAGKAAILRVAGKVGAVQVACRVPVPADEYVGRLKFGLAEVVYEWARGMSFKQITDLTDVLEGSIVRCIVRLDETCRDVRNAARVIGDSVLYKKAETASALIKRDIVFAASLYY